VGGVGQQRGERDAVDVGQAAARVAAPDQRRLALADHAQKARLALGLVGPVEPARAQDHPLHAAGPHGLLHRQLRPAVGQVRAAGRRLVEQRRGVAADPHGRVRRQRDDAAHARPRRVGEQRARPQVVDLEQLAHGPAGMDDAREVEQRRALGARAQARRGRRVAQVATDRLDVRPQRRGVGARRDEAADARGVAALAPVRPVGMPVAQRIDQPRADPPRGARDQCESVHGRDSNRRTGNA
jgi:hypothetical protein